MTDGLRTTDVDRAKVTAFAVLAIARLEEALDRGDLDALRRATIAAALCASRYAATEEDLRAMLEWVDHPEPGEREARHVVAAARMVALKNANASALAAAYGTAKGLPLDGAELLRAAAAAVASAIDAGAPLDVIRGALEEHVGAHQ